MGSKLAWLRVAGVPGADADWSTSDGRYWVHRLPDGMHTAHRQSFSAACIGTHRTLAAAQARCDLDAQFPGLFARIDAAMARRGARFVLPNERARGLACDVLVAAMSIGLPEPLVEPIGSSVVGGLGLIWDPAGDQLEIECRNRGKLAVLIDMEENPTADEAGIQFAVAMIKDALEQMAY